MSTRFELSDATQLPPITRRELLEYFQKAARPRHQWKVGLELERLLVSRVTGQQVPFEGPDGIEALLGRLAQHFGWKPFEEKGRLIALLREGASITLEPGAQVELSTAPAKHVWELKEVLRRHREECDAVIDRERFAWLGVGLAPFQDVHEIVMVPKGRYAIMDAYLPPLGSHTRHMMRGTCSVQAAFDFEDEADAGRKFLTTLSLSPIVNALFGNAAIYKGRSTGFSSYRGMVWENMDPARSGHLGAFFDWDGFSFEGWVEYLISRPMMFYAIHDVFTPAHGRTFKDFMEKGLDGYFPNRDDWEMHLTSVFPEARLKKYLEVRGADCVPEPLVTALPALWKGLFYDAEMLRAAEGLAREISGAERRELFQVTYREGLKGRWKNRTIGERAKELVELATEGLRRQALQEGHADEGPLLEPLEERLAAGESLGSALLRDWEQLSADIPAAVEAMRFNR